MNVRSNETQRRQDAAAISIWDNEGGAPSRDGINLQFGRRIETDRSWTVYHVFTGIPARVGGQTMTGLTQSDATNGMMSLNLRNTGRRKERIRLATLALNSNIAGNS